MRISAIDAGSWTVSPKRRSIVVTASMAAISISTTPAGKGGSSSAEAAPPASGARSIVRSSPAERTRTLVTRLKPATGCWMSIRSKGVATASITTLAPIAPSKSVIQDVAGSPSKAATPALRGEPVSRSVATIGHPKKLANSASDALASIRVVSRTSTSRWKGRSISRTRSVSGSSRQRSIGSARRRVRTTASGVPGGAIDRASLGGRTISEVGPRP